MANSFNPKCNQMAHDGVPRKGIPTCAEVADRGMKAHAAYRAEHAALERLKAAQRAQKASEPVRWLKQSDLK